MPEWGLGVPKRRYSVGPGPKCPHARTADSYSWYGIFSSVQYPNATLHTLTGPLNIRFDESGSEDIRKVRVHADKSNDRHDELELLQAVSRRLRNAGTNSQPAVQLPHLGCSTTTYLTRPVQASLSESRSALPWLAPLLHCVQRQRNIACLRGVARTQDRIPTFGCLCSPCSGRGLRPRMCWQLLHLALA